jgi:hypothetical protein
MDKLPSFGKNSWANGLNEMLGTIVRHSAKKNKKTFSVRIFGKGFL